MTRMQATRLGLVVLALTGLLPGAWAAASPRGFYDDFPGFGAHWVAADGPYNEHLVRDFGALNLALGLLAVFAALWATRHLVVATAVAFLVFGVPHLTYHLFHGSAGGIGEEIAFYGGVALGPVVAAALLVAESRASHEPDAASGATG